MGPILLFLGSPMCYLGSLELYGHMFFLSWTGYHPTSLPIFPVRFTLGQGTSFSPGSIHYVPGISRKLLRHIRHCPSPQHLIWCWILTCHAVSVCVNGVVRIPSLSCKKFFCIAMYMTQYKKRDWQGLGSPERACLWSDIWINKCRPIL